eukprot:2011796-Amphidinium_carterae.1
MPWPDMCGFMTKVGGFNYPGCFRHRTKCDLSGLGLERSHGCGPTCGCHVVGRETCPVHQIMFHLCSLHRRFAVEGRLPRDLPLWPMPNGSCMTKSNVVKVVEHVAASAGAFTSSFGWFSSVYGTHDESFRGTVVIEVRFGGVLNRSVWALDLCNAIWRYLRESRLQDSKDWFAKECRPAVRH